MDFYRLSTFGLFFSFGLAITAWISALPGLKIAYEFDDLQLGFLLLTYGSTSIFMAHLNSVIVTRFGPKKVSYFSTTMSLIAQNFIPVLARHRLAFANWPFSPLYLLCLLNGVLGSGYYTAFTVKATQLEQELGYSCMSSFHAGFSFGALVGSLLYSFLLRYVQLDWAQAYPTHVAIAAICTLTCITLLPPDGKQRHSESSTEVLMGLSPTGCKPAKAYLSFGTNVQDSPFPIAEEDQSPSLYAFDMPANDTAATPRAARLLSPLPQSGASESGKGVHLDANVIRLAFISAFAMMAEATIGDWGGIYVVRECHGRIQQGPLLYGAFACGMLPLRLFGDALVDSLGRKTVFRVGGLLAVCGYMMLLLFPIYHVALFCAWLIGLGVANNVPIIQTSAAKSERMTIPQVTATLSAFNAAAMLGGPSIIGPISRYFGLRVALCVPLVGLTLLVSGAKYLDVNKRV